jgi:two-component system response regulator AtoC
MLALFRRIERVAPIDVPVLIAGETGTGKELVARAIWQLSSRRDRRFEPVNAGALNRELLLSELFGHERGAFTSAVSMKQGLLTVADGGLSSSTRSAIFRSTPRSCCCAFSRAARCGRWDLSRRGV